MKTIAETLTFNYRPGNASPFASKGMVRGGMIPLKAEGFSLLFSFAGFFI